MLQRYNLAFMPLHHSRKFIQLAHDTALEIKPGHYLLGPTSLPHVSVCHFIIEETSVERIWEQVQALAVPRLSLTFSTQKIKIYPPDSYCDITQCGMSLIPNNRDTLMSIHLQITNIIQKPLNAAFSDYDPHLTLFNSYDIEGCNHFKSTPDLQTPIKDTFAIALGIIDHIGQVTHVLFTS